MAKFIELTTSGFTGKKPVSINVELVRYAIPAENGTVIKFDSDHSIEVIESYKEVVRQLFESGAI